MYALQHQCMSLKVDVSLTKLIYVIFEFVLLRITIVYLTKHRYIHVLSAKKPHRDRRPGKLKSLYIAYLCQRKVSDWLLSKEADWRIPINQWRKGYFDPVEV